jgi:hypothetical protein
MSVVWCRSNKSLVQVEDTRLERFLCFPNFLCFLVSRESLLQCWPFVVGV